LGAFGFTGVADAPAVKNQQVGDVYPIFAGDEGHQVALDFDGVVGGGEAEALGEAANVGVYDDTFGLAIGVAEDDVGGFAGDTGKGEEGGHLGRNFATVFLFKEAGSFLDVGGFVAVEAGAAHQFFQFSTVGGGEGSSRWVAGEEGGGDFINEYVGALGGEDGGDEELEGGFMIEGAASIGVGVAQKGDEILDFGFWILDWGHSV
jgi:hypothetical protein